MNWEDDKLDRKQHSEFLTKTLASQSAARANAGKGGLTVALDAPWGHGKSFFIQRMSRDLQANGYPVLVFDAWVNDISDEAGILLMGAISQAIAESLSAQTRSDRVTRGALNSLQSAKRSIRRALAPASKVFAQAALRKVTGLTLNEFTGIFSGEEESPQGDSDGSPSPVGQSLDTFFQKAMEAHGERETAIKDFRLHLKGAIEAISKIDGKKLPLFVFVDELDRCRPTYSIKLLEEVKHLFGVENVCFVISTNGTQLAETIKGQYGDGFDAHIYLKRFFDRSFTLPTPDFLQFSEALLSRDPVSELLNIHSGLPERTIEPEQGLARVLALTSRAFDLDLRSQEQVFDLFLTVCGAVTPNTKLVATWLCFLCACHHRFPGLFDEISRNRIARGKLAEKLDAHLPENPLIRYETSVATDHFRRTRSEKSSSYSSLISELHGLSTLDLRGIRDTYRRVDLESADINSTFLTLLMEDIQKAPATSAYKNLLARQSDLVRHAGAITS